MSQRLLETFEWFALLLEIIKTSPNVLTNFGNLCKSLSIHDQRVSMPIFSLHKHGLGVLLYQPKKLDKTIQGENNWVKTRSSLIHFPCIGVASPRLFMPA